MIINIRKKFIITLLLLLIPFVVLEIWSLNRLSTLGEQINTLEKTKQALILENQLLENEISKYSSLKEVSKKATLFGFEKSNNIEFLMINLTGEIYSH